MVGERHRLHLPLAPLLCAELLGAVADAQLRQRGEKRGERGSERGEGVQREGSENGRRGAR